MKKKNLHKNLESCWKKNCAKKIFANIWTGFICEAKSVETRAWRTQTPQKSAEMILCVAKVEKIIMCILNTVFFLKARKRVCPSQ